jgi:hypothetical protein
LVLLLLFWFIHALFDEEHLFSIQIIHNATQTPSSRQISPTHFLFTPPLLNSSTSLFQFIFNQILRSIFTLQVHSIPILYIYSFIFSSSSSLFSHTSFFLNYYRLQDSNDNERKIWCGIIATPCSNWSYFTTIRINSVIDL